MFSNTYFWIAFLMCLIGYFLFRFGMVSRGKKKDVIEFTGGTILLLSFAVMFFGVSWKAFFGHILIFWFVVTPIVETIISTLQKRLYGVSDGYSDDSVTDDLLQKYNSRQ